MLEQMYQDFTTKLLPQIQEGLVISKEYFMDLFGRYARYLLVSDFIFLGLSILSIILAVVIAVVCLKHKEWFINEYGPSPTITAPFILIPLLMFIGFVNFLDFSDKVVKDIYIPEVRVIEELKSFNK